MSTWIIIYGIVNPGERSLDDVILMRMTTGVLGETMNAYFSKQVYIKKHISLSYQHPNLSLYYLKNTYSN